MQAPDSPDKDPRQDVEQPPAAPARSAMGLPSPALLIALGACVLFAWQWHDSRTELGALRQDIAKKLADADSLGRENRIIAEQARAATAEAQVKLGVLESRIAESQNQQIALEALYQELSRNRDEWAYAEIEQSLLIASQQLQLAGNVRAALIALQAADDRLQHMQRPQHTSLRKAISRDVERLKALPHVDNVGISVRLDNIITAVDILPLAMEVRPRAQKDAVSVAAGSSGSSTWSRFWREAWSEFRKMVHIQRMDRPDTPLLEPSQAFFLRENLKLRLIGARLALLSREQAGYKADLKAARDWIEKYYDTRDKSVTAALATLQILHDNDISIELPDISSTLEALRNYRAAVRERPGR